MLYEAFDYTLGDALRVFLAAMANFFIFLFFEYSNGYF
jgi:hypothetical protein